MCFFLIMNVSPLHWWTVLIQSIYCHRWCHQHCQPPHWTLKGNEVNSLLQNNEKPSTFVQNPSIAQPTWLLDGNSAERQGEVTSLTRTYINIYVHIYIYIYIFKKTQIKSVVNPRIEEYVTVFHVWFKVCILKILQFYLTTAEDFRFHIYYIWLDATHMILECLELHNINRTLVFIKNSRRLWQNNSRGQFHLLYMYDVKLYIRNEPSTHWSTSPGSRARIWEWSGMVRYLAGITTWPKEEIKAINIKTMVDRSGQ